MIDSTRPLRRRAATRTSGGAAFAIAALVAAALIRPAQAPAQGPPAIPRLTDERVYVVGVDDDFGPLRQEIARIERDSPQTYYVVVLRSAGSGRRAARDYLEALVDRWEDEPRFDRKRSVLILLDLDNRKVIVLGGEELQERFGFRDPYIERDLLAPHFYQYARSGDYDRGLRVLVAQIERWIAERDRDQARRLEEARARETRVREDARSTLAAGRSLRDEARRELDEARAGGLATEEPEARFRAASDDLDAAATRLDTAPLEALDLARGGQRGFQEILDRLRRLSASQAELDGRLRSAATQAGAVLAAIERAGNDGLPVAPAQAELEAAEAVLAEARPLVASDPDRAAELVAQAERGLAEAGAHVEGLAGFVGRAAERARALQQAEARATAAFDRAAAAGAVDDRLRRDWAAAQANLARARALVATDPRRAVEALDAAEAPLVEAAARATEAERTRRYRTRTLPALILGGLVAAALAVVGGLWYRRHRVRGQLDAEFKAFREQAVALMDRLDALRQRHRTLAADDPDYTAPMTGSTLALYREVEGDLNALWDRWLRVMEAWERAQGLARTGSTFGTSALVEARKLLDEEGDFEAITGRVDACRDRLDRLNQGHEQARGSMAALGEENGRLHATLEKVEAAGLPAAPYRKELGAIDEMARRAGTLTEADPIGAGDVAGQARTILAELGRRAGAVLARRGEVDEARKAADAVARRAAGLRSDGVTLAEPAADPDPRLVEARGLLDAAVAALRAADPDAAGGSIDRARTVVAEADAAISAHLQARDALAKELPARREAAGRLEQAAKQGARLAGDLREHFAPGLWADVAGHLERGRALLGEAAQRIDAAEQAGSATRQEYLLARSLLAEAAGRQGEAEQLFRALTDRYGALVRLADEVRQQVRQLEGEANRVGESFRRDCQVIGPEAHRSFEAAGRAVGELSGLVATPRPDWSAIRARVDSARQALELASRQGQEDVEGYRKTIARLEDVHRRASNVEAMLAGEQKDRPPANQRYRAAATALARFGNGQGIDPGAWEDQLRRLDEIAADLDRAQSLARQDIDLANGAIAEVSEAARTIREAQAFYASGLTVDVSQAESQLHRARAALSNQAYEQAIELANAAEHLAREARDRTAGEARRRRMAAERGQISIGPEAVVIAAAEAAARAAGRWLESTSHAPLPRTGGRQASQPAGRGGSWGTDAAPASRTSGADEGQW